MNIFYRLKCWLAGTWTERLIKELDEQIWFWEQRHRGWGRDPDATQLKRFRLRNALGKRLAIQREKAKLIEMEEKRK